MEYIEIVRKPFIVEAVEVTTENIEEIAKLVGELRFKDDKPYIQVNRNVVPGVYRVHPGYWMTRMGDNIRCYNKRVFASQFCLTTPDIVQWVSYIGENGKTPASLSDAAEPAVVGEYGRIVDSSNAETVGEVLQNEEEVSLTHHNVEVVVNGGDGH